jgi:hypothetical protein
VPTELNVQGIRVMVYPDDHGPAHVHCTVAGAGAVLLLEPAVAVRGTTRMRPGDVRRAVALVQANRPRLLEAWRALHER